MRHLLAFGLAVSMSLAMCTGAVAHEIRPAYLQITEQSPDHFEITWKQPAVGDLAVRLVPHLSSGWLDGMPNEEFVSPTYRMRTWRVVANKHDPLGGQAVSVEGLDRTITDAIVRVRLADGRGLDAILKPSQHSLPLAFSQTQGLAVPAYFALGVTHILSGIDHLMFVLGLLLLIGIQWRLVKAVTAFTVAHSITLGASAVGFIHAPSSLIEALVALSIVFVAAELAGRQRRRIGITARHPWLIALIFGLLHGFAFAGALAEVGLPKDAVPAALLMFNVGVEVGQLLFVCAAVLVILALRSVWPRLPARWAAFAEWVPPYAIGGFAAFWFLERTAVALA